MGCTPEQERRLAMAMIGEETIRQAVMRAVDEEFCETYGGDDIADRVVVLLRSV